MNKLVSLTLKAKKAVVALAGTATLLIADGTLSGPAAHYVGAAIAFLTAIGVYKAENAPAIVYTEADAQAQADA